MSPVRQGPRCFVVALVVAQSACWADAAPEVGVTVRDSAGVRIVESAAPAWGAGEGWRVDPEPAVEIGAEVNDPTQFLYAAYDVERLGDGRLVVENRGTSQLLVFDSLGTFVEAVGRPGEGPGEFKMMRGLFRCGGDTLVADGVNRVSLFDPRVQFVRTGHVRRIPGDRMPAVAGIAPDCSAVLVEDRHPPSDGHPHGEYVLFWEALAGGERDTVAVFPGAEVATVTWSGRTDRRAIPWGTETVWALSGGTLYLGRSNTPEIRVVDRGGAVRRLLRWAAEPAPVTEADRARFAARRRETLRRRPQEATIFPTLDRFPVPERKPLYADMLVDDEGHVWVRRYPDSAAGWPHAFYPEAGDPPEPWEVFDAEGRWLGAVEIPAALEVLEIQGGYVIGHWVDELDVERIRLHRIHKP